ncbi:gem (nuclear organelle) associated protein 6, isoform CRA_a [Mus musculus]|nr:gem (nuclear organelle) associated protein 6, isoform CRA_a [Mus musculus]
MSEWMKKSPLEWEDYVYKEVRVIACEKEYKGWLLTTDPVSAKHTRREHWIPLHMAVNHHVVAGNGTQDLWKRIGALNC